KTGGSSCRSQPTVKTNVITSYYPGFSRRCRCVSFSPRVADLNCSTTIKPELRELIERAAEVISKNPHTDFIFGRGPSCPQAILLDRSTLTMRPKPRCCCSVTCGR